MKFKSESDFLQWRLQKVNQFNAAFSKSPDDERRTQLMESMSRFRQYCAKVMQEKGYKIPEVVVLKYWEGIEKEVAALKRSFEECRPFYRPIIKIVQ